MPTGQDIANEALEWVGTPFRHQSHSKGVFTDCVGMVRGVGERYNVSSGYNEDARYPRTPTGELRKVLNKYLDPVKGDMQVGDVILFAIGKAEHHLGIYIGNGQIVHAREQVGKVVVNNLGPALKKMTRGVWRFRGIE